MQKIFSFKDLSISIKNAKFDFRKIFIKKRIFHRIFWEYSVEYSAEYSGEYSIFQPMVGRHVASPEAATWAPKWSGIAFEIFFWESTRFERGSAG